MSPFRAITVGYDMATVASAAQLTPTHKEGP
ncbi:hypothetical protein FHS44_002793 [Streptosporangium saharense]|uniref:Uncharacterized protein n=1 Tax=Streptosporangium saharense TaxID=1706840 RepID=A0A7W7QLJ9_9ACTN|nr:hypothetical protein [Streptosporangium saharense]